MKALVLSSFDEGPSVLEVEDPKPGPGEVLVRVAAASINAFDVTVASGGARAFMTYEFPAVIGGDLAGTVEALGDGVDGFAVGDRVFGMMGKGTVHDGSFGEHATPTAALVAKAPDGLRDVDGGSLAVAGTTAMSAIEAAAPTDGTTVLVLGATGGVGSFALQLARGRGAHVIASVRPGDEGFVTDLGAAETVDYTATSRPRSGSATPTGSMRRSTRSATATRPSARSPAWSTPAASSCRRAGRRARTPT